jgi:hypothetical protein
MQELYTSRDRMRNFRIFEPSRGIDTSLTMPLKKPRFLCRSRTDIHTSSKPPKMSL